MKTLYVKDLQASMNLTNEGFAIKSVESAQTKDNKPYYKLILIDKTGEIKAQIWSDSLKRIERKALQAGSVILVDAIVEDYRGTLQLNIFNAQRVDETSLEEYMESSPFKVDELWEELMQYVKDVKSDEIRNFLNKIFEDQDIARKYKTYPAAEFVHHSFRGGLLEHVLEMLDCSKPLKRFYPIANFDLITAGVILHDIGKLTELEPVGVAVQRTTEGYLIGHLIKSYELILEKGGDLSEETMLNLKHIVLSHHGLLEFGSPVLPATIEAVIVSYLDQLSTKARIFQKLIKKSSGGTQIFTEFDRIAGAKIYLGNIIKEQAEEGMLL